MIQVTLPSPEIAPIWNPEPVPALEEWARAAWEWQAMWAPHTLGALMRSTPEATATQDHITRHFDEIGARCWEMWTQITGHRLAALPEALTAQQRQQAEKEISDDAAAIVRAEWVQIPKETEHPAFDPHLDPEMFQIGEVEYLGKAELVDAVVWAAEKATGPDQQTPAEMTVAELQAALDHTLARAERHLVFCDAARWALRKTRKLGCAPERLLGLLAYPIPQY